MASLHDHESKGTAPSARPVWLRVLRYVRPYLALVGLAVLLNLLASGADFGRAYLVKPLLDQVVLPYGADVTSGLMRSWLPSGLPGRVEKPAAEKPPALDDAAAAAHLRKVFSTLILLGAILVFLVPLLEFWVQYVASYALGRVQIDMNRDICAKLLALPLGFHHRQRRGDVYTRAVNDVATAQSALDLLFSDVLQSVGRIAIGVAFLLFVSWKLAVISLLVGPAIFGVISFFGQRIRQTARKRQRQFAEVNQRLLEILSGIKVIKAFRAEAAEDSAYRRATRQLFKRSMKVVQNRLMARSVVELLNQLMTFGALVAGIALMGWLGISIGDLVAFFLISSQSYRPLKKLARGWVRIMDAYAGAERFLEVMDTPVEIRDAPDAVEIGPVRDHIAMRHVTFSYGAEPVLRDVSFEARAGEVVAIVGRTGAGKTTLVDLLMRFYDPDEGRIEVDGLDLRKVTRSSLLGQTGVVTQEPFLFDGSIRENLRYGRPDATEDEVMAAARAAHVDEFVSELSAGYETEVGPSGARLSGGQRQRITIGRAILKDPSILVLDEATSSLDSKSEKYVQDAIDALLGGQRTVFVIAHRLSTVRRADRILVLEDGRISQQGTHEELVAAGGLYRELLALQQADRDPRLSP